MLGDCLASCKSFDVQFSGVTFALYCLSVWESQRDKTTFKKIRVYIDNII